MKKAVISLNTVLIAAVCVLNYFYITKDTILIKSICSGCFALLGLINLIYAEKRGIKKIGFNVVMALGFAFAMLGDVVLEIHFISGAALFAIGHMIYFAAYCTVEALSALDVAVSAVIFLAGGSTLMFYKGFDFGGGLMKSVCIIYSLIISFMVGKALVNLVKKPSVLTAILALGSVLFIFSDAMLVFDKFLGTWAGFGVLCLATYYPAECLLGFSTFYKADSEKCT